MISWASIQVLTPQTLEHEGMACFPFPNVSHAGCCVGNKSAQVFNWADGSLKSRIGHIALFPLMSMEFPRTSLLEAVGL